MNKIRRALQILRQDGISVLGYKSARYITNATLEKSSPILDPLAKWSLIKEGRSWQDANWLLEHKKDRHDALIGPGNILDNVYVSRKSRARHYYRYLFAANLMADVYDSKSIKILDVASGTGYGGDIVSSRLSQDISYFATEIDPEAIRYSAEYYPESEHIQGDVQSLPYSPDTFDVIVSYETIEHVPNPEEALREFNRVLKDGGNVFMSVPYKEDIDHIKQAEEKKYPHRHSFDKNILIEKLNKHFNDFSVTYYQQEVPDSIEHISNISRLPPGINKFESVDNEDIRTLLTHIET